MNPARELPFVMSVLDDGLWLYRRHLAHFTTIAAIFVIPLGILSLGTLTVVRTQISTNDDWTAIALIALTLISYPVLLYMFGALSRAAAAALDGQALSVRPVLRLDPLRGCGMMVFSTIFNMLLSMIFGLAFVCIACPAYSLLAFGMGTLTELAWTSEPFDILIVFLAGLASIVWVFLSLLLQGASIAGGVFALQPFVLSRQPWGKAATQCIDIVAFRWRRSILIFLGAGALFMTLSMTYFGTVLLVVGMLVDSYWNNAIPPLFISAFIVVASIGVLIALLPPLAIWMTIHHQRTVQERTLILSS